MATGIKLTLEEFLKRVKEKHGDKYNYSLVEYKSLSVKIKIICPNHGVFLQLANNHLHSNGCIQCRIEKTKLTKEVFFERSKKIHEDKFDYSLVDYKNSKTKIKIICKKHGVFEQAPGEHLQGNGCKNCANENLRSNKEDFIVKAKNIHGDEYDYSLVLYKHSRVKIKIICKKHGVFLQRVNNHLNNQGCPKCKREIASLRMTTKQEDFIKKAKTVYGDKYDYSLVKYKQSGIKVKINCIEHGIFLQRPCDHLQRHGCVDCSIKKLIKKEEFIECALEKHGDKYDYSLVEYKKNKTKVSIICKKHGVFSQRPERHLKGNGCLKCKHVSTKYHIELYSFLNKNISNVDIVLELPIKVGNKHYFADILFLKEKIIIEYNGDYWHCNPQIYNENYFHKKKSMFAKDIWNYDNNRKQQLENLGYKVFVVWENDFRKNKEETADKLINNIKESIKYKL